MAIFSDLLYPDNPKRRAEVNFKTAQARAAFIDFNNSWNDYTVHFNGMVNTAIGQALLPWKGSFQLPTVNLNPDSQSISDMCEKIDEVIGLARSQIHQFKLSVQSFLEPEAAKKYGDLTDFDNIGSAEEIANIVIPAGVGIAIIAFLGYRMSSGLAQMAANGLLISLGMKAIGGLAIGVLSAVGFVITDLVIGAITGATEREKLQDAISKLDELMTNVVLPLNSMTGKIEGQTSQILLGEYYVSENIRIRRSKKNGKWYVEEVKDPADVYSDSIQNHFSPRIPHPTEI